MLPLLLPALLSGLPVLEARGAAPDVWVAAEPPPEMAIEEPAPDTDLPAAVLLLSRYGPGQVPASAPVLDALTRLALSGGPDAVPLLESIVHHEQGIVARTADVALSAIHERQREVRRDDFARAVPDSQRLQAWVAARPQSARGADGKPIGPHEQTVLAYAALILGEAPPGEPPRQLELVSPEAARTLLAEAAQAEEAGQSVEAITLYAQAAASGSPDAHERLRSFGLDADRLLLGMTAEAAIAPAAILPPAAVDVLVERGGEGVVQVLIERARRPSPLSRVVALDSLASLMEREIMSPSDRAAARRTLVEATRDPRPAVREAAADSLARVVR